jgi:hypothetical protein
MTKLEQINKVEIKINNIRLELIRIISEINRILSSNENPTRTDQYRLLKAQYERRQEEIHYLRTLKKEMSSLSSPGASLSPKAA